MAAPSGRSSALALALWLILALLFAIVTVTFAFETAMHFRGSAIDGPFQLYNSLRRIQAGFHPGVDFQYFHGLGIPYTHYWLYRLLGGGLRGSELARELISATIYPIVFLIFFRGFSPNWTRAVCLTAAAMAISYFFKLSPVIFAINGMLGVRSALPTLLPVALYLIRDSRHRAIAAGFVLGASLFMSTEQGLAAMLAYAVVSAIYVARSKARRAAAIEMVCALALAALFLVLLLTLVAGPAGMAGALRYNFRTIPLDQYWYFGAPPNVFVPSWWVGVRMLLLNPAVALAIVGSLAAAVFYLQRRWYVPADDAADRRAYALGFLAAYALVSCSSLLGVFTPSYVQPARRILLMIALVEWADYTARTDARRARTSWLGVPRSLAITAGLVSVFAFATVPLVNLTLVVSFPHLFTDHLFGDVRFSIAGIWPEALDADKRIFDAHRGPAGEPPVVWSTYAGWAEARAGIFHPYTDYVIHALGPDGRREYVNRFRATRPTLVQTVSPSYTQYEPWVENNQWPFYDELLRSYRVTAITPWSFFWERRVTPLAEAPVVASMPLRPEALGTTLNIPRGDGSPQLLEIEIDYTTHNLFRWLPVVGATPRYLIGVTGAISHDAISLEPYSTTKRFPLVVTGGATVRLDFGTFSLLPGASWEPHALRIRLHTLDEGNMSWFMDLVARETMVSAAQ